MLRKNYQKMLVVKIELFLISQGKMVCKLLTDLAFVKPQAVILSTIFFFFKEKRQNNFSIFVWSLLLIFFLTAYWLALFNKVLFHFSDLRINDVTIVSTSGCWMSISQSR